MKKSPKKLIISYLFFCIIFTTAVASLILLSQFLLTKADALSTEISKPHAFSPTVIIDAGHGGEDGGAIGINGIYEKDLNLKIATELADMNEARFGSFFTGSPIRRIGIEHMRRNVNNGNF